MHDPIDNLKAKTPTPINPRKRLRYVRPELVEIFTGTADGKFSATYERTISGRDHAPS